MPRGDDELAKIQPIVLMTVLDTLPVHVTDRLERNKIAGSVTYMSIGE